MMVSQLNIQPFPFAPLSDRVSVRVHRGLHSVCGSGEEQQFGHQLAAGPEELSQWRSMDRRLESPTGLPAVPQLPELVKGAPAESW